MKLDKEECHSADGQPDSRKNPFRHRADDATAENGWSPAQIYGRLGETQDGQHRDHAHNRAEQSAANRGEKAFDQLGSWVFFVGFGHLNFVPSDAGQFGRWRND